MRRLFLSSTALFWLAVCAVWFMTWSPLDTPEAARTAAAERTYTLAQVAQHASEDDCWMVIAGQVYDLTAYLPEHPSDPAVTLPWCGREASEAYRTKTKGRAHSPYADRLLPKYRIGQAR